MKISLQTKLSVFSALAILFLILIGGSTAFSEISQPASIDVKKSAREFVSAHHLAYRQKADLYKLKNADAAKAKPLIRAYTYNIGVAKKKYAELKSLSLAQGAGETSLTFPLNSAELKPNSTAYRDLVQFINTLSRNSNGRKILLFSIGGPSSPGEELHNSELPRQRTMAPIPILEQHLINFPHESFEIVDESRAYSPKTTEKKEVQTHRRVKLMAVYDDNAVYSPQAMATPQPYAQTTTMAPMPPQMYQTPETYEAVTPSLPMPRQQAMPASQTPQPQVPMSYQSAPVNTLPRNGFSQFTNTLGMNFIYVPAGTFTMGSPSTELRRSKGERQHEVTLTRGYWLMNTEVTQGQWIEVMGENPSHFMNCGLDCPVENVRWSDVKKFIEKLNQMENTQRYRLPTEAEWENAARGGTQTAFFSGPMVMKRDFNSNQFLNHVAWYYHNSDEATHQVAGKEPNAWGFYDMHGNVWEWCNDWHSPYPFHSVVDPDGAETGSAKIRRGGSWAHYPEYCRSAYRSLYESEDRSPEIGFRLALSDAEPVPMKPMVAPPQPPPCAFQVYPASKLHAWKKEEFTFQVSSSAQNCEAIATPNQDWIHIPHPAVQGDTPVTYVVDANPNPNPREGIIHIGETPFHITQMGRTPVIRKPRPLEPMPEPGPIAADQCILVEDILFADDSSRIQAGMKPVLDRAAFLLNQYEGPIELRGHTSGIGNEGYNKALGEKRARAVKEYLIYRGVDASRMKIYSLGEVEPKYTNKTSHGRRLNRRVEIRVLGSMKGN